MEYATSLSKSDSMTGFRAGYVVADEATISKLESINSIIMTSAPEFVQYSVIAALQCKDYVQQKVQLSKSAETSLLHRSENIWTRSFMCRMARCTSSQNYIIWTKWWGRAIRQRTIRVEASERSACVGDPGDILWQWYREFVRMTLLQSEQRIQEGIERMAKVLSRVWFSLCDLIESALRETCLSFETRSRRRKMLILSDQTEELEKIKIN